MRPHKTSWTAARPALQRSDLPYNYFGEATQDLLDSRQLYPCSPCGQTCPTAAVSSNLPAREHTASSGQTLFDPQKPDHLYSHCTWAPQQLLQMALLYVTCTWCCLYGACTCAPLQLLELALLDDDCT